MAKTRALMTETERARIAGEEDLEEIERFQAVTRVRRRIEDELPRDVAVLREHQAGLLEALREAACADSAADLAFTPLETRTLSYGPSSREGTDHVLRVGTRVGTIELQVTGDEMSELCTAVRHPPRPEGLDGQGEADGMRRRLVDAAMEADAETVRAALSAMDSHRNGE